MQRSSWLVFAGIALLLVGCGTKKAQESSRPFIGTWTRSVAGLTGTWVFNDDGTCMVGKKRGTWQEANGVIAITHAGEGTYQWNWSMANDGKQLTLTRQSSTGDALRRVLEKP